LTPFSSNSFPPCYSLDLKCSPKAMCLVQAGCYWEVVEALGGRALIRGN
jgi:hypothetical protein